MDDKCIICDEDMRLNTFMRRFEDHHRLIKFTVESKVNLEYQTKRRQSSRSREKSDFKISLENILCCSALIFLDDLWFQDALRTNFRFKLRLCTPTNLLAPMDHGKHKLLKSISKQYTAWLLKSKCKLISGPIQHFITSGHIVPSSNRVLAWFMLSID